MDFNKAIKTINKAIKKAASEGDYSLNMTKEIRDVFDCYPSFLRRYYKCE